MSSKSTYPNVVAAIREAGLWPRGGFHPTPDEEEPRLANGRAARTVILAGNVGGAMWSHFETARPMGPDPLDQWSRTVLGAIAERFGGELVMPSDGPPYQPFQQWARRAEPVHVSPLGVLIHPEHGLWHGYRGALLFAERLDLPNRPETPNPCHSCAERPCLSACPVAAFDGENYDVSACADHISTSAGHDCIERGCGARRACPIGRDSAYSTAQNRFHMTAFLHNRPRC